MERGREKSGSKGMLQDLMKEKETGRDEIESDRVRMTVMGQDITARDKHHEHETTLNGNVKGEYSKK